ncbi:MULTISPECIES: hypothetical protein [unclassified Psychrobacter]|uniref:hypothetical protein n=1 Tax=unclassified Psychrobacter TaxID=196806 RepID=UPI00041B2217|nr:MULTISPECIES: hypothetical protein [unclassified Psychrobacter]
MTIIFSQLVSLYREAKFDNELVCADYHIQNSSDLDLVCELLADNNFEKTQITHVSGDLSVGNILELQINPPSTKLGWLYQSVEEFVKSDFPKTLSTTSISKNPYYIVKLDYYSKDCEPLDIITNYDTVKRLLQHLASICIYPDVSNKKLVFFSKYTFEVSYDIANRVGEFIQIFTDLNQKTKKVIEDFCDWLDDDQASKHLSEKKAILSYVLANTRENEEELNLIDIVLEIQNIYNATLAQFDLYIEDFRYEKFVKKLEENSEKFINRVNDSISKILSQVLALPIAAAIPALLRSNQIQVDYVGHIIIALALIAYATICYFALTVQSEVLSNIKTQVEQFEDHGKIPSSLKEQWGKDKKQINSLIQKQRHLYYVMMTVVFLVIIYGGSKLFSAIFS